MIDSLKPASADALPCKICGSATALYGVVDFNKSCMEGNGVRLPLSGVPIYYRRCANCEFLFTDAFDGWSDEQFKAHIYNDGYGAVDPDYETTRPQSNAEVVRQLWGPHKAQTRVLDYGGGNDAFCAALRADGFPVAVSYDPMVPAHARRPQGKFELVTCFETLEHLPDPVGGIALLAECVAEPGLAHISTFAQPADFATIGLNWWYVAPRNGHISIFSRKALALAFGRHGYKTVSLSDNLHFAFRTLPTFADQLSK
jgi:2-polyprenyl-6-hydroxyphenyl methylase/3-demethylubiquinone-9 3-methyltransferase